MAPVLLETASLENRAGGTERRAGFQALRSDTGAAAHRGRITHLKWQRNYNGVRQAADLRLVLEGPAGSINIWLRDRLGLSDRHL